MGDAHDVDTQHPFPIGGRALPDQAAGADAGVVEDDLRRAEPRQRRRAERLDLGGAGDVETKRQHLGAERRDLGGGVLERVLLHVGHDDVHAALRGEPRRLEAEARSRTRDDGRAALEVLHALSFLIALM